MDVYEGCRCPFCLSIMFPFKFEPFRVEMEFTCPRGCCVTVIHGIFNKIPQEYQATLLHFFGNEKPYQSKCWNCKNIIDSKHPDIKRDKIISLGFVCSSCGESLRGLMVRDGRITQNLIYISPRPRKIPWEQAMRVVTQSSV